MKRWWSVPAWWLFSGALLVVACDMIENRKFDPPPGTVIGPAPIPGARGYTGTMPSRGIGGSYSYDAGTRCIGVTTDYCIATCFALNPALQAPVCDQNSGSWTCPPGWSYSQTCPIGSCASPGAGYCCAPQTGTLTRPPCNMNGYYDACATGSFSTGNPTCLITPDAGRPDTGTSSACRQLANQPCTMQGVRCNDTTSTCFCQPVSGALSWLCASTGTMP